MFSLQIKSISSYNLHSLTKQKQFPLPRSRVVLNTRRYLQPRSSSSSSSSSFRSAASTVIAYATNPSKDSLNWPVERVRNQFIDYFVKKQDHTNYLSSPCVPVNDPTLLFANAGMNQFKPIFIGTVDPSSPLANLKRVVNTQKCIRAGGKHNDLEDVGKDTYHHTFFEMLGTWSFGNYFKKEAIDWAYDILVYHYGLDPNRIYASYFAGDEGQGLPCDTEARDLWLQYLPKERVLPFDKKANFWEMGDTGPCGPCSEIHYDRIGNRDASKLVNADDPDVIEIWNLVFIQYNRENNGQLKLLPNKHIDTGMGLERLTSILQNVRSNYDTDVFLPIFHAIQEEIGCLPYAGKLGSEDAKQNYRDTAYRVIADHLRTLTFAITDGAYPSNEGRGYVLRRVLRRAVRYGMQTLGAKPGFFSNLIPIIAKNYGNTFPELIGKVNEVITIVKDEELSFASLLEKGIRYFNDVVKEQEADGGRNKIIEGKTAFFLYDSLGFPIDLTQIMASEKGFTVDIQSFQQLMNEQRERGRRATLLKRLEGRDALTLQAEQISLLQKKLIPTTNDQFKYSTDTAPLPTTIQAIFTAKDGFQDQFELSSSSLENVPIIGIILEKTNFYSEAGGQIADTGTIEVRTVLDNQAESVVLEVLDTQVYGGYVLHSCVPAEGTDRIAFAVNDEVLSSVDQKRRKNIAPNHSMTHVLNYALRKVLGENIDQKGSLVSDEKLRFDFSHPKALTKSELFKIEEIVNDIISKEYPISTESLPLSQAKSIAGLRAVFGEVYPDPVRVLSIGATISELTADPTNQRWKDYSIEFCGGIHLSNTKEAEYFTIIEETAVAKGIRRITAVTKQSAKEILHHSQQIFQATQQIEQELQQFTQSIQSKNQKATAEELFSVNDRQTIQSLEEKLTQLRQTIDSSTISANILSQIKEKTEIMIKQLFQLRNQELQSIIKASVQSIVPEITASRGQQGNVGLYVLPNLPIENGKIIKLISDEIGKIDPQASFLCILPNAAEKRVLFFSNIQNTVIEQTNQSLTALKLTQQLIERLSSSSSGKAGGKMTFAQGSLQQSDDSSLQYDQFVARIVSEAATTIKQFGK